jgi:hypothetical protein
MRHSMITKRPRRGRRMVSRRVRVENVLMNCERVEPSLTELVCGEQQQVPRRIVMAEVLP